MASSAHAADVLAREAAAGAKRLLALCRLAIAGEMSVGDLAEAVGLSQSALSQHLAKLRFDGLVETRREAQVLHYRISDPAWVAFLPRGAGLRRG